jgi:Spy/CpxP family protein refolding chaperone
MVKRLLFGALLAGFAGFSLSHAPQTAAAAPSGAGKQGGAQNVRIPGTD